jgi:putative spermidine/putrescine transport system ATP-binding protein
MTVAENVGFPLRMRNLPSTESAARIRRALDMVQLGSFSERRPNQLSGGQQQRVAVARALVFEPSLVLMDEPLGALDKQLREQMQGELRQLHRHLGVTMIYVTHDQSEALTMSDRIAVFNDGRIEQLATPAELYERPGNAFVAYFIGESNRLLGRVTGGGGEFVTVALADGRTVRCLGLGVSPQQAVCLSVRPERILIGGAAQAADNVLEGRIRDAVYHGDHLRLGVTLDGAGEMILKIANAPRATALAIGDSVTLGWNAADCRAFPMMGSTSP